MPFFCCGSDVPYEGPGKQTMCPNCMLILHGKAVVGIQAIRRAAKSSWAATPPASPKPEIIITYSDFTTAGIDLAIPRSCSHPKNGKR